MNNDIVVKQKPGSQPAASDLAVKQPPQSAVAEPQPTVGEADMQNEVTAQEQPPTSEIAEASKQSNKPIGIIATAVIIALCLVTIAVYIGYNQS